MEVTKKKVINVRNPRTGKYDYQITPVGKEELNNISKELLNEQTNWQNIGVTGRVKVMQKWKEVLIDSKEALFKAVSQDTGRHRESYVETTGMIKWIDNWSVIAEKELVSNPESTYIDSINMESDYSAYPLVGVISPWNYPMSLSLMDTIPALIAGSAVIIKPSEITPRFADVLMETIKQVPELAKVLIYVQGAGETGAQLLEHVDMVCFTGSVATGRKVAVTAAERFIPAFLELGGKDPAIITDTVDIDRAAFAVLTGSVTGAGHQCFSLERIYVQDTIIDEFVKALTKKAKKLKLAYPNFDSGEIGPLIFEPQAEIITEHLKDAVEKGATIHTGGEIENHGGGLWCRPTVITGVNHNMKIMKEETFGPIMPIMAFKEVDEAIKLANDSEFGLSGAVLTGTVEESLAIARRVDAGGISINDIGLAPLFIGSEGSVEKTAFKQSGLGGSRLGSTSIKRFVRKKSLIYNTTTDHSPWWYEK